MVSHLVQRWSPLIAGIGAMLCITALGSMQQLTHTLVWLMAPFGATMVILFGLPDSPLAQPRNIVFGHLLTSFIGLAVLSLLGVSAWSMGLAVGLAVALMLVTKTTHPPAGANPILIMLTGQTWGFLLSPVATGTLFIVLIGVIYHRGICRRDYPLRWF